MDKDFVLAMSTNTHALINKPPCIHHKQFCVLHVLKEDASTDFACNLIWATLCALLPCAL